MNHGTLRGRPTDKKSRISSIEHVQIGLWGHHLAPHFPSGTLASTSRTWIRSKSRIRWQKERFILILCANYTVLRLSGGKSFLHEHPATALSWKDDQIQALMKEIQVMTITAHQCQYGLVTPSAENKEVTMPALKPTRFITNSQCMANQLSRRCGREHVHQPLVGNRCRDAAYYPLPLVKAMLRGIALQATEDKKLHRRPIAAMPMKFEKRGHQQEPKNNTAHRRSLEHTRWEVAKSPSSTRHRISERSTPTSTQGRFWIINS